MGFEVVDVALRGAVLAVELPLVRGQRALVVKEEDAVLGRASSHANGDARFDIHFNTDVVCRMGCAVHYVLVHM